MTTAVPEAQTSFMVEMSMPILSVRLIVRVSTLASRPW
jgi:hypothetical protein